MPVGAMVLQMIVSHLINGKSRKVAVYGFDLAIIEM